jgi:hypothetical protein
MAGAPFRIAIVSENNEITFVKDTVNLPENSTISEFYIDKKAYQNRLQEIKISRRRKLFKKCNEEQYYIIIHKSIPQSDRKGSISQIAEIAEEGGLFQEAATLVEDYAKPRYFHEGATGSKPKIPSHHFMLFGKSVWKKLSDIETEWDFWMLCFINAMQTECGLEELEAFPQYEHIYNEGFNNGIDFDKIFENIEINPTDGLIDVMVAASSNHRYFEDFMSSKIISNLNKMGADLKTALDVFWNLLEGRFVKDYHTRELCLYIAKTIMEVEMEMDGYTSMEAEAGIIRSIKENPDYKATVERKFKGKPISVKSYVKYIFEREADEHGDDSGKESEDSGNESEDEKD